MSELGVVISAVKRLIMIVIVFSYSSLLGTSRNVDKLGNVELYFYFKFIVKLLCLNKNSCTKILPRIYISSLACNYIDISRGNSCKN